MSYVRSGERSKSSSVSEAAAVVEEAGGESTEPLLNGDIKAGRTPVVSINTLPADREGATSPRSTLVSTTAYSLF